MSYGRGAHTPRGMGFRDDPLVTAPGGPRPVDDARLLIFSLFLYNTYIRKLCTHIIPRHDDPFDHYLRPYVRITRAIVAFRTRV